MPILDRQGEREVGLASQQQENEKNIYCTKAMQAMYLYFKI